MTRLNRGSWPSAGPPRPVRAVHLGLGAFHRSHQAWYTEHAADAEPWGIAAFTGRNPGAAQRLQAQDCLYTLVERGPERDRLEAVSYTHLDVYKRQRRDRARDPWLTRAMPRWR